MGLKTLYCNQYKNSPCCISCHNEDEFFKAPYKGFELVYCCGALEHMKEDIDNHDEGKENDCV